MVVLFHARICNTFCKIWIKVLQIGYFSFINFLIFLAIGMHSVPSKTHLNPNPNPLLSLFPHSLSHRHSFTLFTFIGIDFRTVSPTCEGLPMVMNSWAQLGPLLTPILPPSSFFLFRGGGGWSPLVKWIKIPNSSNNNDNKKLIKNGMFLPDCASVVVFNYAIFIGILIIFSTNKPPLIKAKHG